MIALAAAEAKKVDQVGLAQAEAITRPVKASGGPGYRLARQMADRFAQGLSTSGVDLVPRLCVAGGGSDAGGSLVQTLRALALSDCVDAPPDREPPKAAQIV